MSPSHGNVAHPGHQGGGLVPGLLVQLVTLEPLGALGDGGPVHLNLATTSAMDEETQNYVYNNLSQGSSPERRPGRVVVVVDHALDVLHELLLVLDFGGRACVIGVALIKTELIEVSTLDLRGPQSPDTQQGRADMRTGTCPPHCRSVTMRIYR